MHRIRSKSNIVNQASLRRKLRLERDNELKDYKEHAKGYFEKPVHADTNPYSIRQIYDPDATGNN